MDIDQALAQLGRAIESDDPDAGKAAALMLVGIVLRDVGRIAAALEHIGRNLPAKP